MSDAPHEQYRAQEAPVVPQQLAWQPSAVDYHSYGTSTLNERAQANNALIDSGILSDLQFDFGNMPILAQSETKQGYAAKAPDLDSLDMSKLSPDAQFGGAAGNWARYVGREAWHTLDAMGKPGGTDQTIFGSIVNAKHYYAESSLQSAFNDISQLGQDVRNALWNIPSDLQKMTPDEQTKASAKLTYEAAFFFLGAKAAISEKAAKLMNLEEKSEAELRVLGIEKRVETQSEKNTAPTPEKDAVKAEKDTVAASRHGSESLEHYISKPINGAERFTPLGFKDEAQFFQAAHELTTALKDCGITDATLGVRGSSVTGYSDYKGTLFHPDSDVDFFFQSAQLSNLIQFDSTGFNGPKILMERFPELKEWSTRWTMILGRPISPAAFAPDKLPTTPAIKLERD